MGIAIAVIVYGLLRYWGLPGWGATLAALPVLFDPREMALESYILPDTLFCLVIVVAVALLLTRRTPRPWQCLLAGLLFAYAAVLRGNGILLVLVAAVFLLVRRVGWRALAAAAIAFAVPVGGYALQFHAQHGQFNLTRSDGIFLWSRTTSFANCAIIRPPADLRPLCPDRETPAQVRESMPSWSASSHLIQGSPADYLWAADAWWRTDAHPGFSAQNNKLGLDFAVNAIKAQPLGYLRSAAEDVALTVHRHRPAAGSVRDGLHARAAHRARCRATTSTTWASTPPPRRTPTPSTRTPPCCSTTSSRPGSPACCSCSSCSPGWPACSRTGGGWGGTAFLPWALAVVILVSPALLTQTLYRYALAAVPLACLAAGLSSQRLRARRTGRGGGRTFRPRSGQRRGAVGETHCPGLTYQQVLQTSSLSGMASDPLPATSSDAAAAGAAAPTCTPPRASWPIWSSGDTRPCTPAPPGR